ncbi:hypothetical protein HJB61_20885 [Rhizobium lentis]|nr:hypothetical protein [Rhizobium lentis]
MTLSTSSRMAFGRPLQSRVIFAAIDAIDPDAAAVACGAFVGAAAGGRPDHSGLTDPVMAECCVEDTARQAVNAGCRG